MFWHELNQAVTRLFIAIILDPIKQGANLLDLVHDGALAIDNHTFWSET